jgi:hypothetical protein
LNNNVSLFSFPDRHAGQEAVRYFIYKYITVSKSFSNICTDNKYVWKEEKKATEKTWERGREGGREQKKHYVILSGL